MADLKKAGWYLAFGNVAVFVVACAITLAFDASNAIALMG